MMSNRIASYSMIFYIVIFFTFLFGPLVIMSITAFNSADFPRISPWDCLSFRWFNEGMVDYVGQNQAGLMTDQKLKEGFFNSLYIGFFVVIFTVPIGLAAAIMLTQINSRLRELFYSLSIMPVLFPGVIIGISTVVLWNRLSGIGEDGVLSEIGRNGIFLTILAQTCFISTYCFLIFVARLQRFDRSQEEAALDLGASQTQVFFKILLPYLAPAIASSAVIAFLASFENYNTTVFSILSDRTLTTVVASKVRLGITPAISALAFTIIAFTIIAVIVYEIIKRRSDRLRLIEEQTILSSQSSDSRIQKLQIPSINIIKPLSIVIIILITLSILFTQLVRNNMYGDSCIVALEEEKKKKIEQQRKLEEEKFKLSDDDLKSGNKGDNSAFDDIFNSDLFQY